MLSKLTCNWRLVAKLPKVKLKFLKFGCSVYIYFSESSVFLKYTFKNYRLSNPRLFLHKYCAVNLSLSHRSIPCYTFVITVITVIFLLKVPVIFPPKLANTVCEFVPGLVR